MMRIRVCYAVVFTIFSVVIRGAAAPQVHDLVILDTAERDAFLYRPTLQILESVGFTPKYVSLDQLIDKTPAQLALAKHAVVLFVFGMEFLRGMTTSHLGGKVLRLLDQYARQKNVTVGLVFPPMRAEPGANLLLACEPIMRALGVAAVPSVLLFSDENMMAGKHAGAVSSFLYTANIFLSNPLETRPLAYHTTLNEPHPGIAFDTQQIGEALSKQGNPLHLLPMHSPVSDVIRATLPYGVYWHNPLRSNHVFITTTSLMSFAGITENFQLCPSSHQVRMGMLQAVQRMFFELAALVRHHKPEEICAQAKKLHHAQQPVLPISYGSNTFPQASLAQKIAWMEICKQTPQQQEDLVRYIFDAQLTSLWITLNPHMYYSPIARSKDKLQEFWKDVTTFTQLLAEQARIRGVIPPCILIGYEITNNVYEPHLPKHNRCAVDMYHNVYPDLPAPLDTSFWHDEVIDPLKKLVAEWNKPEISHGIKLTGIVLDLEMYCRKKTGTFSTLMGFDGITFKSFTQAHGLGAKNVPLKDRVLTLMHHHCAGKYFNFLEHKATRIGYDIAHAACKAIPGCEILCYMPNLHISWFYKGLCKGLAEGSGKRLMLLTFNSEFNAHQDWFVRNHIPAQHASVLMLSKIKSEADYQWVDDIMKHHDGIWLNRFSRFIEPKARDWTSIEQPMMPQEEYGKFLGYLAQF